MGFIDERALFKECHGNLGCCDGGLVDVDFETTDLDVSALSWTRAETTSALHQHFLCFEWTVLSTRLVVSIFMDVWSEPRQTRDRNTYCPHDVQRVRCSCSMVPSP